MHHTTRLAVACCCLSVGLSSGRLAADSGEGPGTARVELDKGESAQGFNAIVQVGAKLLGKGSRTETPAKDAPEAEPKGTSSASAKKAALSAMPLDQLTPENRQKASALLKAAGFYRRLPKVTFSIEPEVYSYFLAHPDVAVSIWRAMKISKLEMWQTGRYEYEADTGDGSTGKLEVLLAGPEKSIVITDGMYKSPLFGKAIEAKSLLLLHTSFVRDAEGTVYATHWADLFIEFPSQTIDVIAKIFSPLTLAMTDRTFSEISLFLKMMSLAMALRPDWVDDLATKMDGIPEIRREQVKDLTAQVHSAAQKKLLDRVAEKDRNPSAARTTREGIVFPVAEAERGAVPASGTSPASRE